MDPRLAEIYGTNKETEDVEKTAADELAEKLAGEEDELNLDGMSSEELEALAKDVLSADAEEVAEESTEEKEEKVEDSEDTEEKTASEQKLEEADYLGRVMAHAYVHELKEIDKTAGVKDKAGKVLGHLKGLAGKAKGKAMEGGKKGKELAMKHKGKAGLVGAGMAAGGAGGYMLGKKKHSSAVDALAVARAKEILEANGIELEAQPEVKETEKKAAESQTEPKYDTLAKAVEARAVEMLKEEGYTFSEE